MQTQQSNKTTLCAYVRTPDGTTTLCEVKEIIYSPFTLLEQVAVKAIQGAPFNGCNYAIVQMSNIHLVVRQS